MSMAASFQQRGRRDLGGYQTYHPWEQRQNEYSVWGQNWADGDASPSMLACTRLAVDSSTQLSILEASALHHTHTVHPSVELTTNPWTVDMRNSWLYQPDSSHSIIPNPQQPPTMECFQYMAPSISLRMQSNPPMQADRMSTSRRSSMIPTPTRPPTSNAYSHSVYWKEGRRSVMSFVKRYRPGNRRHSDTAHNKLPYNSQPKAESIQAAPIAQSMEQKTVQSSQTNPYTVQFQAHNAHDDYVNQTKGSKIRRMLSSRTPASILPQRRINTFSFPSSATTPSLSTVGNNMRQSSLPNKFPRTASSYTVNTSTSSDIQPARTKRPFLKKVRLRISGPSPFQELPQPEMPPIPLRSSCYTPFPMSRAPSRIPQWLRGRMVSTQTVQNMDLEQPRYHKDVIQAVKTPGLPEEEEEITSRHDGFGLHGSEIRRYSSSPTPLLQRGCESTPKARTQRMVTENQPREYWLGRFVTLTNSFHYEDSFHEPDTATAFGRISSFTCPPEVFADTDLSGYRARRAFMVLERLCMTEEARRSLQEFRQDYILRFGDGWMTWPVYERMM